jgi:outer membrane protein TolC
VIQKSLKKFILCVMLVSVSKAAFAASLMTLQEFITKMKTSSPAFRAQSQSVKASGLGTSASKLLTSPQLFLNANSLTDRSPTTSPLIQGNIRRNSELQSGVQMQMEFGLKAKAFVGQSDARVTGADPTFVKPDQAQLQFHYYGLEFEFPILRNGFGRDISLKKEIIENGTTAEEAMAQFEQLQLENKAILSYLNVAKLREVLALENGLVEQGQALVAWTKKRVSSRILEPIDLSLAEAALEGRELQIQVTQLSLLNAEKDFNALRDEEPNAEVPQLEPFERTIDLQKTDRAEHLIRRDHKALVKSIESEKAEILLRREGFRPELNLVARTIGGSNLYYLGLVFEAPLDVQSTLKVSRAALEKIAAKEMGIKQSFIDSTSTAQKLLGSIEIFRSQRDLTDKILETQKLRLAQERRRQRFGRASAYDIIRAEQEYVESQLNRLNIIYSQAEVSTALSLFEAIQ